MCSCHSILECCVMFSGVKLNIRSFVLFLLTNTILQDVNVSLRVTNTILRDINISLRVI